MANLLGVPDKTSYSPPNTFRAWHYGLIFCVLAIGSIYALPNLYQPDPAIQIRSQEQVPFESDLRIKLREELVKNGVYPKSIETAPKRKYVLRGHKWPILWAASRKIIMSSSREKSVGFIAKKTIAPNPITKVKI